MLLEGIFPAITTPFLADGRLYLRKLEENVERYSRAPVSGIVVLGSTGEAVMLDDDESREVLRTASQAASPQKVLLAGTGRESAAATLKLAECAADLNYDAVLVRTPSYYGPLMRPLEMATYFRTIADRSPLPVVLYSIPKFTKYELPVDLVADLAAHPNIIGIKDSSGSIERIAQLVAATRNAPKRRTEVTHVFTAYTGRMHKQFETEGSPLASSELLKSGTPAIAIASKAKTPVRHKEVGFQVLSGSPDNVKQALDAGATGSVLAFGACAPQACQEIYMAWKDNDPALAMLKQERILEAARVVAGKFGIPGIKFACDLNGYYGGFPRVPLLPLHAEEQSKVVRVMEDIRN
jgi:4-hydroxy-2-oxoglutarate aldolase